MTRHPVITRQRCKSHRGPPRHNKVPKEPKIKLQDPGRLCHSLHAHFVHTHAHHSSTVLLSSGDRGEAPCVPEGALGIVAGATQLHDSATGHVDAQLRGA